MRFEYRIGFGLADLEKMIGEAGYLRLSYGIRTLPDGRRYTEFDWFSVEPPGFRRDAGPNGELCLNCKFLRFWESKPECGRFEFPVMHWYYCKGWESDGELTDLGTLKPVRIRPSNRDKSIGE